jgi:glycosyltransferase involved in cell wall biosynthesis
MTVVAGPADKPNVPGVIRVSPRTRFPTLQRADWAVAARDAILANAREADVALISGGPFAPFALGPALLRRGVPYVLDFRDPWSWEPRFGRMNPGIKRMVARFLERLAERCAVSRAAAVLTVAPEMTAEYGRLYSAARGRMYTVRHGFNPEDFEDERGPEAGGDPVLMHAGSMVPGEREPDLIVEAARRVRASGRALRVVLQGSLSPELVRSVDAPRCEGWLVVDAPVPHRDAVVAMRRATALWLEGNEQNSFTPSGKVYEYLAARRPIVAALPSSSAGAALLRETGGAIITPPEPDDAAVAIVAALDGNVPPVRADALSALAQPAIALELDAILRKLL